MKYDYNKKKYLLIVFIAASMSFQIHAQSIQRQSIGSIGFNMSTNGISISQTIGQPYSTLSSYSKEVSFRPGFQQPYYASRMEISSSKATRLNLSVYPNPAVNSVSIDSPELINNALIQVTTQDGRIILKEYVSELRSFVIQCENWPNGLYLISLYHEDQNKFSSKLMINK